MGRGRTGRPAQPRRPRPRSRRPPSRRHRARSRPPPTKPSPPPSAPRTSAPTPTRARRTRTAMSYLDLLRRRADGRAAAARRGRRAGRRGGGRRGAGGRVRARRRGRPVRRRHERRRRRRRRPAATLRRGHRARSRAPRRAVELDEISRTATLQAGPDRPARRGAARQPAASRSATCRRASSARRSAATRRPARPGSCRPAGAASTRWWSGCGRSRRRATLDLGRAPGTAAGPDLRQLLLGSEGAFGVITEVTVRVRPLPEVAPPRGLAGGRASRRASRCCGASRRTARGPISRGCRTRPRRRWGSRPAAAGRRAAACCSSAGRAEQADVAGRALATAALLPGGRRGCRSASRPRRRGSQRPLPRAAPARRAADRRLLIETLETAASWRDLERVHDSRRRDACAARSTALARSSPATSRTSIRQARRSTSR